MVKFYLKRMSEVLQHNDASLSVSMFRESLIGWQGWFRVWRHRSRANVHHVFVGPLQRDRSSNQGSRETIYLYSTDSCSGMGGWNFSWRLVHCNFLQIDQSNREKQSNQCAGAWADSFLNIWGFYSVWWHDAEAGERLLGLLYNAIHKEITAFCKVGGTKQ